MREPTILNSYDLADNIFPEVILTGNGPCISCCKESTQVLMKEILGRFRKENNGLTYKDIERLPFPMQVVAASNDHVDIACEMIREKMISLEYYKKDDLFKSLLDINSDAILTTNYSYDYEMVLDKDFFKHSSRYEAITSACGRYKTGKNKGNYYRESKEQLHSFYRFDISSGQKNIWHIHGEAKNKNSIVLGHYYYSSLLASYISENKKYKDRWKNAEDMVLSPKSWIDYFIFGNVYILGFAMDFGEYDLWWLLNRKKREVSRPHGRTVFFVNELEDISWEKRRMFSAYGVEIFSTDESNFGKHYELSIQHIKNNDFWNDVI